MVNAPSKVQSALLEAMEEKQVTIGDQTYPLPSPFLVLATQNPIEQEGTYSLPEAQVDRFMLKVLIDYPDKTQELGILNMNSFQKPGQVNSVISCEQIARMGELIDMSASQKFGTFSGSKLDRAAEVASILAFNAIKNNDKVGVIFFTDQVEKYIPPKKGSGHIWRVIKEIFTFVPQGKGTNISRAMDYLAKISRKRSIVFVLSDFLDQGYLKSMRMVRQRHEVIGIMIYDKGAFKLPVKGIITLSDFETSKQIVFDGFNKKIQKEFRLKNLSHYKKTLDIFSRAKSDVIELELSASVSDTLLKYFRSRERRMR